MHFQSEIVHLIFLKNETLISERVRHNETFLRKYKFFTQPYLINKRLGEEKNVFRKLKIHITISCEIKLKYD